MIFLKKENVYSVLRYNLENRRCDMELNKINIKERMEHYNVTGLSIAFIENAQITKLEQFGLLETGTDKKVNRHSYFNACSISKFLTGILVMNLIDKGFLYLDQDINQQLTSWKVPDSKFTKNKKVTLRNLLSHQSGILDPKNSFIEFHTMAPFPSMLDLLEGSTIYCQTPIDIKYEPETEFHYSDAGFCIIQQLIEDITQKPFKEVVKEQIFQPLSMKNSTFEMPISKGNISDFSCGHNKFGKLLKGKYPIYPYHAASGLWTTPMDLATLVIELMNALQGKSKIGLSVQSAKEMIQPQGDKNWTGLGMFLDESESGLEISSLGWGVGFQSMMVGYPHLGSGLVIMTNTDLGFHQLKGIIGEIYRSYLQ